jgi:hypothetical protein
MLGHYLYQYVTISQHHRQSRYRVRRDMIIRLSRGLMTSQIFSGDEMRGLQRYTPGVPRDSYRLARAVYISQPLIEYSVGCEWSITAGAGL